MFKLKTTVSFECAHRLMSAYSEACTGSVHGHSYYATFYISRPQLNEDNMVCDFKKLKEILHDRVEKDYDHACILAGDDPLVGPMQACCKKVIITSENPTAESMARHFYYAVDAALKLHDPLLKVESVEVQETEHNIAIYQEG